MKRILCVGLLLVSSSVLLGSDPWGPFGPDAIEPDYSCPESLYLPSTDENWAQELLSELENEENIQHVNLEAPEVLDEYSYGLLKAWAQEDAQLRARQLQASTDVLIQAIKAADPSAVRDAYKNRAVFDDAAFKALQLHPDLEVARQIAYLDTNSRARVRRAMGPGGELV